MEAVTLLTLANEAFGTHLSGKHMIIKQHFYWSKQLCTKVQSPYLEKRTDIIDLRYNIEECPAANDYFTD